MKRHCYPDTDSLYVAVEISGRWDRSIVADCIVFNIETWNRRQPRFPLSRIP